MLANLNNFSGLWTVGAALVVLMSGSGMIRGKEYCLLECKSQTEKVVQVWALDWLV